MKPYANFKSQKNYGDGGDRLPAGNYVGKILNAKEDSTTYGDFLVIAFDIIEGDYTGYFQRKFDSDTTENKKWKGVCRIRVPDEKSKYFVSEKTAFENAIYSIEDSNPGYHFDWDEKKLKGKIAGFRFRDKEFINNFDEVVMFTECLNLVAAEDVRNGEAKLLKPKLLPEDKKPKAKKDDTSNSDFELIETDDDDDDIPFL